MQEHRGEVVLIAESPSYPSHSPRTGNSKWGLDVTFLHDSGLHDDSDLSFVLIWGLISLSPDTSTPRLSPLFFSHVDPNVCYKYLYKGNHTGHSHPNITGNTECYLIGFNSKEETSLWQVFILPNVKHLICPILYWGYLYKERKKMSVDTRLPNSGFYICIICT